MSILTLFKSPTRNIQGVVERIGPHFGAGEIYGYDILLAGEMKPMVVLRDSRGEYPIGLTMPGDEVTFEINDRFVAGLSSFQNKTLNIRLAR